MKIAQPTAGQLKWQALEFGMFCHFGINTFYGKEWSDGTLDPAGFNPARFDARQWVAAAREAGVCYLILTAKHHDGFCLWPTATTRYSVASAPWRGGAGDVVAEVAAACRAAGLPFGLYLSPWDRNAACYADPPAYDAFYTRQLEELCTGYGPLVELWFDGAGSEGRVYDWERIMAVVERHQPEAMVFNMGRPTIRWIGNEDGLAADPCLYAVNDAGAPALAGSRYCPPECDVPIRRNWFWQPDDLSTLKSLEHLLAIYYRSIGLGAGLLLNVPPDRAGLLDPHDVARLGELAAEVRRRFADPLPGRVQRTGDGYDIDLGATRSIDHLVIEEDIAGGQFVDGFAVYAEGRVAPLATGRTLGRKRILVFPVIETRRLRVQLNGVAGRLVAVTAYRTGHERAPEPGPPVDYDDVWAAKVDRPV